MFVLFMALVDGSCWLDRRVDEYECGKLVDGDLEEGIL